MLSLSGCGQANVVLPFEANQFVSTWKTSNISTGSSTTTQIKLPLVSTGTYNFVVEWGDGTSDTITTWDQAQTTHTYTTAGLYQIKITGTCYGLRFANTGDRLKILSVEKWGNAFRLGATDQHFNGCGNLELNQVDDVLDLTGTTSFENSFARCSILTKIKRVNEWDTSSITNLRDAFTISINFDDNIGNWNTSNVTSMTFMFLNAPSFNNGGSSDINNWDTSNVNTMRFMFGNEVAYANGKFNQPIGNWNTSKVTNFNSMFYRNPKFNQNIGTKVVTKNGVTYTAWDTSNVTDMSFMFSNGGSTLFPIQVGDFNNGGSDSIKNWNTSKVTNMASLFSVQKFFNQDIGTKVVTVNGVTYTAWDTLNVTSMSFMLNGYTGSSSTTPLFNNGGSDSIKNWNTSKVTTLISTFQNQSAFNQDISTKEVTINGVTYLAWDTLNVTNMSNVLGVYQAQGVFNQPVTNWNTSKVTTLQSTFAGQKYFNQDVGTKIVTVGSKTYTAWDTLNVTSLGGFIQASNLAGFPIFYGSFNNGGSDSIKNWNTSKVTSLSATFYNQTLFNQNISTKTVTVGASTYTAWDTLNVTSLSQMFQNSLANETSAFNQNISNWNTSKVTTFNGIFGGDGFKSFNQDISIWNTANVTIMDFAFRNANNFNQNIGLWNTAKVTTMKGMLNKATSLNQNLANWNVSLVTGFDDTVFGGFADQSGLSTTNYDALLIGWSTRPVLPNLAITFGTTKYSSSAVAARAILTSAPNNWTIIDGGLI